MRHWNSSIFSLKIGRVIVLCHKFISNKLNVLHSKYQAIPSHILIESAGDPQGAHPDRPAARVGPGAGSMTTESEVLTKFNVQHFPHPGQGETDRPAHPDPAVGWAYLVWHVPPPGALASWLSLLVGLAAALLPLSADFGHALAHIFSARAAGVPMDEILIAGDMPGTIYHNNDVAPAVHRQRALGGPVFNMIGLLLSLAVFALVRGSPVVRELMAFSAVGHGLLLVMSLFPLPLVDGGTALEVEPGSRGRTPCPGGPHRAGGRLGARQPCWTDRHGLAGHPTVDRRGTLPGRDDRAGCCGGNNKVALRLNIHAKVSFHSHCGVIIPEYNLDNVDKNYTIITLQKELAFSVNRRKEKVS